MPHVPPDERTTIRSLGYSVFEVVIRYGFMDEPNVPEALARAFEVDEEDVTFFLGRETLIVTRTPGMASSR